MAVKILAADDSATMRRVLEMTFAGEAVEIETVATGEAAVERAQQSPPDLVIADLSMGTDGYEVARALKSNAATENVAVVVLASQHLEFDAAKAKAAGVDDHIVKPYDTQAMIDKAKEVLSKPRASATAGPPSASAPSASAAAPSPPKPPRPPRPSGIGRPGLGRPTGAPSPRSTVAFGTKGGRPVLELADEDAGAAPKRPPVPSASKATAPSASTASPAAASPAAASPAAASPAAASPTASPAAAASPASRATSAAASATSSRGDMAGQLSDLGLSADQIEAVLALSREVIERVVWEVVPDLAEVLIKEEIKRLTAG